MVRVWVRNSWEIRVDKATMSIRCCRVIGKVKKHVNKVRLKTSEDLEEEIDEKPSSPDGRATGE